VSHIDHDVLTYSKLYFTACGNDQYDCEDLTCIASELRCNQVENCRFRWDEDGCPVCTKSSITRLVFEQNLFYNNYWLWIISGRRQQIDATIFKFWYNSDFGSVFFDSMRHVLSIHYQYRPKTCARSPNYKSRSYEIVQLADNVDFDTKHLHAMQMWTMRYVHGWDMNVYHVHRDIIIVSNNFSN